MARAIHKKTLLEHEVHSYKWVQYQVRNLADNLKIHLEKMEKAAGGP
jgi:hypothetical protein